MDIEYVLDVFANNGSREEYDRIKMNDGLEGCVKYLTSLTGCTREDVIKIIRKYPYFAPTSSEAEQQRRVAANAKAIELLNKPKCSTITGKPIVECPYCHSTNTKKISGLSKMGSVAVWGVFAAGKVSKQWKCNNCKSEF